MKQQLENSMLSTLKSFTDAVMSIIATIMVLEIPLPKFIGTNHSNGIPV